MMTEARDYSGADVQPERASALIEAVKRLGMTIGQISEQVDSLSARLTPVLRPSVLADDETSDVSPTPVRSEIAAHVASLDANLTEPILRLAGLLERLDLP